MYEAIVRGILSIATLYLAVGCIFLIPLHRRRLAVIDPGTRDTGIVFKVLITPGLVTLWPLLLRRWRQASRGEDTAGKLEAPFSPEGLRRWHGLVMVTLAILCPTVIATALYQQSPTDIQTPLPAAVIEPPVWVQPGITYGRAFPSLPARVMLARNANRDHGLLFDFDDHAEIPPTALYWAEELNTSDALPATAVFVGMIWGPKNRWVQFPQDEMFQRGHWIVYSFAGGRMETFSVPGRKARPE